MRLFYIIFFLSISISFAAFASQEKKNNVPSKNAKISFITGKKNIKSQSDYHPDNESLQKDIINNAVVKISLAAFLLLPFLMFLFIRNNNIIAKAVIKTLNHQYGCLFKMLYPKHVFW